MYCIKPRDRFVVLLLCFLLCLPMGGCGKDAEEAPPPLEPIELNMNTDYPRPDTLADGEGKALKVVLLLGQSNATGASIVFYLEKGVPADDFARYTEGFSSVLINFCLDDHNATSQGEFVKVDLRCGATDGFFGPEVGMAEVLSAAYPDETVVLLKYTMSGYSLAQHWLANGARGSIYNACLTFLQTYMEALRASNYDAQIGAICWMQGESDTTEQKAAVYYDNQTAFVSYLREDLAPYAADGGIYFIDAGISDSPYCEPAYPTINDAKLRFSEDSPLNIYFSTIDAGFTIHKEPEGDPDWGHYDALCELELGRMFGERVVQSYAARQKQQGENE